MTIYIYFWGGKKNKKKPKQFSFISFTRGKSKIPSQEILCFHFGSYRLFLLESYLCLPSDFWIIFQYMLKVFRLVSYPPAGPIWDLSRERVAIIFSQCLKSSGLFIFQGYFYLFWWFGCDGLFRILKPPLHYLDVMSCVISVLWLRPESVQSSFLAGIKC